jgi:hypothetical protein
MFEHTPGPWKVTKSSTTFVVVDKKFSHFVAEAADEENARLLSLAPELLEFVLDIGRYVNAGKIATKEDRKFVSRRAGDLINKVKGIILDE